MANIGLPTIFTRWWYRSMQHSLSSSSFFAVRIVYVIIYYNICFQIHIFIYIQSINRGDYLTVYDGENENADILWEDGDDKMQMTTSNHVFVTFTSDNKKKADGFFISLLTGMWVKITHNVGKVHVR